MRKILLGAGLRLTALYTLAFMLCVAAVGLTTRHVITAELQRQARRQVETEASALVDEFDHGGRPDLDAALAGRRRNADVYHRYALIEADVEAAADPATADPGGPAGVAAVRTLADGSRIVVSDDLARVRAVVRMLDRAFSAAFGAAALLGLGMGVLLSRSLLRRLDRIRRTAEAVAAGDLASRIAATGSDDEFDRLATTLNRMLDRIGVLLANLRQVSNDVAHDLRTPMSRLRQGLEAVDRADTSAESYRVAVGQALAEIDAILEIFSALLRIAQIESGSRRAGFRAVNLSEILSGLIDTFGAAAEEVGVALSGQIPTDLMMRGDRELLVQLFVNLVENALQHARPAGQIAVRLERRSGTLVASVIDDGPGIPAADRDKVFRRFYRVDASRSDARHGLGLSLAAAVVELHEGEIRLGDAAPGLRVDVIFAV